MSTSGAVSHTCAGIKAPMRTRQPYFSPSFLSLLVYFYGVLRAPMSGEEFLLSLCNFRQLTASQMRKSFDYFSSLCVVASVVVRPALSRSTLLDFTSHTGWLFIRSKRLSSGFGVFFCVDGNRQNKLCKNSKKNVDRISQTNRSFRPSCSFWHNKLCLLVDVMSWLNCTHCM